MSFVKNARVMLLGFALAQAVPLLASPFLTRLYSPEAFGLQALFIGWATVLSVIATTRIDLALMLAKDDREAGQLVGLVLVLLGVLLGVLILLSMWLAPTVARWAGQEGHVLWIWSLPPMVAGLVAVQVSGGLLARSKRFGPVSGGQVVNQFGYLALAVTVGLTTVLVEGLTVAKLFGQLAAAIMLLIAVRNLISTVSLPGPSEWPSLWSRFKPFVLFNTPYSLVGVAGREMPIFAFMAIAATASAGFYGLARTLLGAPATLLAASLSQVFYREAVERRGSVQLKTLTSSLLGLTTRASAPLFAFLAVWADVAFGMFFGNNWETSGIYAMILSFPAWLAIQTAWPERLFESVGRQGVSFAIQISFDVLAAVAVFSVLLAGLPHAAGVAAFSAVNSLFHIAYLAGMFVVAGFPLTMLARILGWGIGVFAGSAALFLACRFSGAPLLVMVMLSGVLALSAALFLALRGYRVITGLTTSAHEG
jgi:O-antigen/teichoic acid export membrane protein